MLKITSINCVASETCLMSDDDLKMITAIHSLQVMVL